MTDAPITEAQLTQPLLVEESAKAAPPAIESKGTFFGTTFNLANNVMGSGFLTLPWAFKNASIVVGGTLLLMVCMLSCVSFMLLVYCCEKTGSFIYKEIGSIAVGTKFGTTLQVFCVLYTFGACTSYIVMIGDFLPSIIATLHGHHPFFTSRYFLVVVCVGAVIFPLSLPRNLDALKYTSFTGIIFVIYTTLMIFVRDDFMTYVVPSINTLRFSSCVFLAIPVTCVAFTAHYNAPRFYQELKNRTPLNFGMSCVLAMTICFLCYFFAALSGYLQFGPDTKGNILINFPSSDVAAAIAKIGFSFTLIFHYPLVFHNLRSSLSLLITPKAPDTLFTRGIYSVILLSLLTLLGLLFKDVEIVLGFNGAIFGSFLVFTFPGTLYIILHGKDKKSFCYYASFFMILFGLTFCVMGTISTAFKVSNHLNQCV